MSLTHDGFGIPGTHEEFRWGEWDRAKQENRVFGLDGYTEIDGGRAKRPFAVPIWIHNSYSTVSQLLTALDNLDGQAGTQGQLVETDGSVLATYEDVLFERFDRQQGPLPSSNLGWFMIGTLHFVLMTPG